jgi:hypothetical protein
MEAWSCFEFLRDWEGRCIRYFLTYEKCIALELSRSTLQIFMLLNSVRIFQCGRVENSVVVQQCFESRTRMSSHFLLSGYSGLLSSSFLLSVFHPKTVTCGYEVHDMRILCCC